MQASPVLPLLAMQAQQREGPPLSLQPLLRGVAKQFGALDPPLEASWSTNLHWILYKS